MEFDGKPPEEKARTMIYVSAAFAVSQVVMLLHKDAEFDAEIPHQILILQAFKDSWIPRVKERFHSSSYLREAHKVKMTTRPGYCEPQLLCLFQAEIINHPSETKSLERSLSEEITKQFQLHDIPAKNSSHPVISKNPVKTIVIPKLPLSFEEHLIKWTAALEGSEDENPNTRYIRQKFKELIYSRKSRILQMIHTDLDFAFPTIREIIQVFAYVVAIMEDALNSATGHMNQDDIAKTMRMYLDGTTASERESSHECRHALQSAKARYEQLVPEFYTKSIHEAALREALETYSAVASGLNKDKFRRQLIEELNEIWRRSRQQCETTSVTGHPCRRKQGHIDCEHDSRFVIESASSSGLMKKERRDPFTFLEANVDFYAECESEELGLREFPLGSQQKLEYSLDLPMVVNSDQESPDIRCTLSVLGDRSLINSAKAVDQPGLMGGKNKLFGLNLHLPVCSASSQHQSDFDMSFPPLAGTETVKRPESMRRTLEDQIICMNKAKSDLVKLWPDMEKVDWGNFFQDVKTSSANRSRPTEDLLIGIEYESMEGNRLIASPKQLTAPGGSKDLLHSVLNRDIPLYLAAKEAKLADHLTSGKKPKSLFQLQRIFFVTPGGPISFATQPKVVFRADSAAHFHLKTPLVLPVGTFSVLRLPFVYGIQQPFVQESKEYPYDAYVERRSIIFPA